MRLDRYVSHSAGITRRDARALIRAGRVAVGGRRVTDVACPVDADTGVAWDGAGLDLPQPLYLMMHKPCGVVSATRDRAQATVLALLPAEFSTRVHPVGRLDKDTSGLLLLTDDGAWSHRVTSPRRGCPKTYVARLAQPLVEDAERRLAEGLMLRNEQRPTGPAVLRRHDLHTVSITITEGRYHQVRRMFAALGNRVLALHRERIGGLTLDGRLQPGQWRALTSTERAAVTALAVE